MFLFVVNERSGNGRGKRTWKQVENELRRRGTAYGAVRETSGEEAFCRAESRIAEEQVTALVAVGGDGTLHGLLPLAIRHRLPLGFIPCGSGNDSALAFDLPKHAVEALDIVLAGRAQPADYMVTSGADGRQHYAFLSLAVGLDGAVAEDVNGSRYKKWCNRLGAGPLAYIIGLFRMLAVYKPGPVTVTVDGRRQVFADAWLAAVANLPSYGGGLRICPGARPGDGLLHICVVHGCTVFQLLRVFPAIFSGSHVKSRFVTMLTGCRVTVEAPYPLPAYGDGEPAGRTPVLAEVQPLQLLFLAAESG